MRWALLLFSTAAFGQTFDVASVKPSPPLTGDSYTANLGTTRHGELTLSNATLADCIKFAWGLVSDDQVGGPDWIKSKGVRFDIIAKAPPATERETLLLMLQTLIKERFHLEFHPESRVFSHFVLSISKNGSKLKEVKYDPDAPRPPAHTGQLKRPQILMYTLALLLSRQMKELVIDRTGLTGWYEIDLHWTPEGSEVDNGPTIFTALQEQLGLRLEGKKGPVEIMVVDRADRVPVEN